MGALNIKSSTPRVVPTHAPAPKPRPKGIPDNIKRTIEWMCDRMAAMYGDKSKPAGGNIGDVRKWLEGKQ